MTPALRFFSSICAAGVLAGCGAGASSHDATLVLDFTPNAVHAGIYSALARGFDRAAGVHLRIREPSSSTDSVKLLLGGRADFAVLDIHDLAIARAAGRDVVGVLPLVQRPLAAVLAQPQFRTPQALAGHTAGVSGLPSDDAVLRSILEGAPVHEVTIGFDAVPALLGGRVAAATAFWDVEGIALRRVRPAIREFRVDDYGAPAYPELVVSVAGRTLRERATYVRAVVAALRSGYAFTRAEPQQSAADELARVPGLDRSLLLAEMSALRGAFGNGRFDLPRLRAWAAWEARFKIVRSPPDVGRMFGQ
ncbi:MAG: ABC transporter substrate-binding protein [Candidatus Eremiobacteraeota bacterium]|nr:ABC transporter substrate-binding protein [Candidatus Eremiobacteraeota bacterium]